MLKTFDRGADETSEAFDDRVNSFVESIDACKIPGREKLVVISTQMLQSTHGVCFVLVIARVEAKFQGVGMPEVQVTHNVSRAEFEMLMSGQTGRPTGIVR